jgi:hypothetical protein
MKPPPEVLFEPFQTISNLNIIPYFGLPSPVSGLSFLIFNF